MLSLEDLIVQENQRYFQKASRNGLQVGSLYSTALKRRLFSRQLVLYLTFALDCDVPIVEAVWWHFNTDLSYTRRAAFPQGHPEPPFQLFTF